MAENDHDNDYDLDFGNKSRILRAESIQSGLRSSFVMPSNF
jgi:hypothetical protein